MARHTGFLGLVCLLAVPGWAGAANKKHLPGGAMADTYVLETSQGNITIELDRQKAPLHAANFASYADAGFFDGLIFHRVIPDFMIQAGGHTPDMAQKAATGAKVKNESLNGLKNLRGTLAAARTSDPDSASSQFFINLKDNAFLDGDPRTQKVGYSVFGRVTAGMDVVDKIARVQTGTKGGHGDVPNEAVVIKSVKKATK
jgi:cyclophilin family peptidyl-prolyl cis-trans isomerase